MTRHILTLRPHDGSPGREVPLTHFPFRIGRSQDNDLCLPFLSVSTRHLEIRATDADLLLLDLGSTNGTRLEGRPLSPGSPVSATLPCTLHLGDVCMELRPQLREFELTVAASNTELRHQADSLAGEFISRDRTLPCFEILSGPDTGRRFYLDPDSPRLTLGTTDAADLTLRLSCQPALLATLSWQSTRCVLTPETDSLLFDGQPMTAEHLLTSGDRFVIGPLELLFFDPLQHTLELSEPAPQAPSPRVVPPDTDTFPQKPQRKSAPLTGLERALILLGSLTALVTAALLFWFFLQASGA